MEKLILLKPTYLFWMVLVCVFPLLGACQKEGKTEDGEIVPLSSISENPEYADLPFIGTRWQLIGFANAKTGKIKKAEKPLAETYTVLFDEDGTFSGQTYSNMMVGEFEADLAGGNISIIKIGGTEINEFYDGRRYLESMREVSHFTLSSRGLALYYDSENYLLFKPLRE